MLTGYETGLASLLLGTSTTEGPPGGGPVNYFEAEPAIDKSPKKEEVDVVRELADQLPNLPLVYLHANKGPISMIHNVVSWSLMQSSLLLSTTVGFLDIHPTL